MKIGGKHSRFEKDMTASIKILEVSIQKRTNKISAILVRAYSEPNPTSKYWAAVRRDLNVQYRELQAIYSKWSNKNIPAAYKSAMRDLFKQLNRSKDIARRSKRSYLDLVNSPRSNRIQNVLVKDAIADWTLSLKKGQTNLNRMTRKTQQALVKQSFVDTSVVKAIGTGNLMNNTFIKSINMSDTLAGALNEVAEIIDGEKYVIAGSRRYRPKYYAEMVTRVKFHEAQSLAAVGTAGNYGTSLLQVSSHNTSTAICLDYEGKIFSIGGKDNRFPPVETLSPFHVNCLHLMFPTFESGLEVNGGVEKWSEFSKNKIDRPPSPANFIPVKDRLKPNETSKQFDARRRKERRAARKVGA